MSTEQNKALIRRFYEEVWGKGNVDVADEVFAPDYVRHDLRLGNPLPGPAGQKQIATDFRAAFPDLHFTLELLVAEADMVRRAVDRDGHEHRSMGQHSADGQTRQVFGGEYIPHREWQGGRNLEPSRRSRFTAATRCPDLRREQSLKAVCAVAEVMATQPGDRDVVRGQTEKANLRRAFAARLR